MARADEQLTIPIDDELAAGLRALGWAVTACEGELLRASRFRPVFRYRVACGAAGERIVIGKADYRHGGARTFAFMQRLWDAGLVSGEVTWIPEPIAYLDDLDLLVQTEAPGRCLYEWLAAAEGDVMPSRRAGGWLGRLHQVSIGSPDDALPPDFEPRKLSRYCEELSDALPHHAAGFEQLTAATLAALAPLDGTPGVPTHGDYQPKNIYVDGPRVTVIDWDRGALAHPARDIGHFAGQCLTMSYSKTGTFALGRDWNAAFLAGYAEAVPGGVPAGVAPYVARTFLEILYYKLVVKPVRDPAFVPVWLDEVDQVLAA